MFKESRGKPRMSECLVSHHSKMPLPTLLTFQRLHCTMQELTSHVMNWTKRVLPWAIFVQRQERSILLVVCDYLLKGEELFITPSPWANVYYYSSLCKITHSSNHLLSGLIVRSHSEDKYSCHNTTGTTAVLSFWHPYNTHKYSRGTDDYELIHEWFSDIYQLSIIFSEI